MSAVQPSMRRSMSSLKQSVAGSPPEAPAGLAAYFRTSAEFWLNLQTRYDLKMAQRAVGEEIKRGVRPLSHEAA